MAQKELMTRIWKQHPSCTCTCDSQRRQLSGSWPADGCISAPWVSTGL